MRRQVRKLRERIAEQDASGAQEMIPQTFSIIDRAAKWGIIKPNAAARYKSRLHKSVKKLSAA
jgi:small subunit ribosomal protein S20